MVRQSSNCQVEANDESNEEGGFHTLQPIRDSQANFEVDLAKKLEEYLLKICSGEELPENEDHQRLLHSVNFAEAALLIQGSIQVYSRKVEYLYTLVVHALEFISQKRQDHQQGSSDIPDKNEINAVNNEAEYFLDLDDVPYVSNILNDNLNKSKINYLPKPPTNLVVQEGDCLYTTDDSGEFDSYLLSTCNFYEDFLLLDPRDSALVHDFVKSKASSKKKKSQGSLLNSTIRRSCFLSPSRPSGGSCNKSGNKRKQDSHVNDFSGNNLDFNTNSYDEGTRLHADSEPNPNPDLDPTDYNLHHEDDQDAGNSDIRDSSDDEDDPWKKPLDPYQLGDLKVKPFRRGKPYGRRIKYFDKKVSLLCELLPLAKLDEAVGLNFSESVKPPNDIEKLRQSLVFEEPEVPNNISDNDDDGNNDNAFENELPDFEKNDFDMPQFTLDKDPVFFSHETQGDDNTKFDEYEPSLQHDLDSNSTLEELCRSHLDSLLASIAETEMQTELMERVSTWKQRIEHTLDEQDSHPFDIHVYGEKILDRLSTSGDSEGKMSFTDIVIGQHRHDIARTFSALLQLVNNRSVDLNKNSTRHESFCHTAENPFYAILADPDRMHVEPSKKPKSPSRKGLPQESKKRSLNIQKGITIRHPHRKKSRRGSPSRSIERHLDSYQ